MKKLLLMALMITSFAYAEKMVKIKGGNFDRTIELIGYSKIYNQKVSCGDFMISDSLVTIKEFSKFLKSEDRTLPKPIKRLYEEKDYDEYPIYYITFMDALKFCNWKSKRHNLQPCYTFYNNQIQWNRDANGYRLPTEIEWECAATQAGKDEDSLSGDLEVLAKYGEILTDEEDEKYATYDDLFYVRKLKQYAPNKNKLYDMFDVVSEFCWDFYCPDFYIDEIPNTNYLGILTERVVKGSITIIDSDKLETHISPICRTYGILILQDDRCIGFRVARNIPEY